MSPLQKYTQEEILTLSLVPLWVFYAVAGADSVIDHREIGAFKGMLKDAPKLKDAFARAVLSLLYERFDEVVLKSKSEQPIRGIERAMSIISQKSSPSESEEFKVIVFAMGWSVAAASGDFTETGEGSNISDEEIENLTHIADALSLSMAKLRKVIVSTDAAKIWNSFLEKV
ncbi:MAG: TerB family tellurite resistance protein [Bacteroidota bacterium]|nr:TerB family tellurite resistance protein [Candidatus Kapabacteria bacterium]MDW8219705.1 TerB family tellurite resistance protein [Bacteroidota bacterium]